MQAVVFPQPETIALERVADPTPADDEVVVQVARCGICGTDVHIFRNEYMSTFPLIPGHEFGGTVVAAGRAVTDVRVGDRVAVDPNLYCGRCDFCRNEQANHCRNWQGVGVTRPGGFAEYVAVPARACYRLPAEMSDLQAGSGRRAGRPRARRVWRGRGRHRHPGGDRARLSIPASEGTISPVWRSSHAGDGEPAPL